MKRKFKRGELIINTKLFLGYDKDEFGYLVVNREEAKIVDRIFTEYLKGKGVFTIAKELNDECVPTIKGGKWQESTILHMLKNEKYKGGAHLQKYYTPDYLMHRIFKNNGEVDSYYIEGNHPPIVSEEVWEKVQEEIIERAKEKGNIEGDRNKYPLTGLLYCSKCGFSLRRRTWNSKHSCKKIVWQCSNYIMNGKASCSRTKVDDEIVSTLNIEEETIVEEGVKNGKKHYFYTSKNEQLRPGRKPRATEKENVSILQSVNRPIRTVIQL